jgi:hypothetical protein
MISTNFSYEVVNTSYLKNITDNMHIKLDNQNINIKKKSTIDNKLSLIVSNKI